MSVFMFQSKNSQGRFWLYHCMYCLRICLRLNTYKNISTYTKLVTAYVCPLVIGERIRKPSLEMFTDMRFMSFSLCVDKGVNVHRRKALTPDCEKSLSCFKVRGDEHKSKWARYMLGLVAQALNFLFFRRPHYSTLAVSPSCIYRAWRI